MTEQLIQTTKTSTINDFTTSNTSSYNIYNNPNIFSPPSYSLSNTWTIATTNTQGFHDHSKRAIWFTYLEQSPYQIIIHTETNSKSNETHNWKIKNFQSWWHSSEVQFIGSDIGISLHYNIAKHVFKIQQWLGRIITLDLVFPHKRILRIIAIYFPATQTTGKTQITSIINKLISEAQFKQWHTIIARDFNTVTNPQIDKSSTNKTTKHHYRPTSQIIQNLIHEQFINTYRQMFPTRQQHT